MSRLSVYNLGVVVNGGSVLLSGVDLHVDAGEWVGLIGPNGAGKTTMLHAITGIANSFGSVKVNGEDLAKASPTERARRIALVPQRPVIPPGMDAFTYVLLGRTPHLSYFAGAGEGAAAASRNGCYQRVAGQQLAFPCR